MFLKDLSSKNRTHACTPDSLLDQILINTSIYLYIAIYNYFVVYPIYKIGIVILCTLWRIQWRDKQPRLICKSCFATCIMEMNLFDKV